MITYLWFVCANCSGFNWESFVLQQVAERTLHIPSLGPLAPFSGLFMSIFLQGDKLLVSCVLFTKIKVDPVLSSP